MIKVRMSPVNNPRTPDGQWENMEGCPGCGTVHAAYVRLDIYQDHFLIAKNIRLCKSCLVRGKEIINRTILGQVRKRVQGK